MEKFKTLVIGLDGASFNFTRPWIEQGLLPNFQALMQRGSSGEMQSTLPPITMPAWRVYSTGKGPGKLGVFWHQQIDMATRQVVTPNASMIKSADWWDYLNQAGLRAGIVGMPDLFPPRPVDGFVVAGGPSASSEGYTYPAEIAAELEGKIGYRVGFSGDIFGATHDSPIVQDALHIIDVTFQAAEYLLDRYPVDFLMAASFEINRLQHFFYDEEPTRRAWQIADRWLGKLAPRFDYVFIMSDHGTERLERAFFLNVWLRQNGYLVTRFKPQDILPKIGINRTSIAKVVQALGLRRIIDFDAARKFSRLLPAASGAFGDFGNQGVLARTDWAKTRALALPQGPVYINRAILANEQEYQALRDELIHGIQSIRDPETARPVFRKVYRREEAYPDLQADQRNYSMAPDLLAITYDQFHNRAGLNQTSAFVGQENWHWKGNNRLHGMFMAAGPGIRSGYTADGARIIDLAPTLLHVNGLAVAEDMDGRVLEAIIEPGSPLANRSIAYQPPLWFDADHTDETGFNEKVGARLKDLGYIE